MEEKNIPQQDSKTQEQKKSSNKGPIIFLAILAILLALLTGFSIKNLFETRSFAEVTLEEKNKALSIIDELKGQLNNLEADYDKLSEENEHLEGRIRTERAQIQRLRAELRSETVAPEDAGKFKEKIKELEDRLEEYRRLANVCESDKQSIIREKSEIETNLSKVKSNLSKVEEEKVKMGRRIDKGSHLSVCELNIECIREGLFGDREVDRARRTDRMEICFTINENHVAEPGERDIYIRIIDPRNRVLSRSGTNTIEVNGREVEYSTKRTVNFRNERIHLCEVWKQTDQFTGGAYNITIYAEGREIAHKMYTLE